MPAWWHFRDQGARFGNAFQHRGISPRVQDVKPTCQDSDRRLVDTQGASMRSDVDPECATGDYDLTTGPVAVSLSKMVGHLHRDILAIARRSSAADDGNRPLRRLIDACRAKNPQPDGNPTHS